MVTERTYIVPLRRQWVIVPKYRRAKKAVSALQAFITRHMKSGNIRIGKHLNEAIWARRIKSPPHKIKITVVKEDDGMVKAELFGHKYTEVKKIEKEEKPSGLAGKLRSALGKTEAGKEEEKKEDDGESAGKKLAPESKLHAPESKSQEQKSLKPGTKGKKKEAGHAERQAKKSKK